MTAMFDHAGRIEAGEKTIADRDAEIATLTHKAQGLHRVADKLAVTVEGLEAELADVRMKHEASRKRASDLEAKHVATVNGLQIEFTGQMSQLEKMLGQAEDNLEDFRHAMAESMADTNRMKIELGRLRVEHGKCPGVIAGLRKQIKDTRDALEMDHDDIVEGSEGKVGAGSVETETPLDVRVKLGASAPTQRGRVKLGAGMTTGGLALPVPAASGDDAGAAEDQTHQACTLSGIASLRKELAHTRMAHEERGAAVAAKDAQIEELKADLVRLDMSLAQELDRRQALTEQVTKQLAEADQRQASLSGECWVCDRRD